MTPTLRTFSGVTIQTPNRRIKPEDIRIVDIAHGLAQVCRFSGQTRNFYSVGAHSVLVSEWIEKNGGTPLEALAGLLHDASEAYIADLPSPIKRFCRDYRKIERNFMKAILTHFGLPKRLPKIVHEADQAILTQEKLALFGYPAFKMNWRGRNCKREFLRRFNELKGAINGR